ncbi:MAG: DNA repair protein RadC [bacterium]
MRAQTEQPRERLLNSGAQTLSSTDLIALCLGSGVAGESAQQLAQRLIQQFGGPLALLAASTEKLLACHGVGQARAAQLKAVYELACRNDEQVLIQADPLQDVHTVSRYVRRRIGYRERETFACLFLDTRYRPICWEELFLGSVNRAHVHPREVLKRGIELNAAAVVLAHNHPSGIAEPSQADLQLTRELKDLLRRIDIEVIDHIIVSATTSVSLAARGLLGA